MLVGLSSSFIFCCTPPYSLSFFHTGLHLPPQLYSPPPPKYWDAPSLCLVNTFVLSSSVIVFGKSFSRLSGQVRVLCNRFSYVPLSQVLIVIGISHSLEWSTTLEAHWDGSCVSFAPDYNVESRTMLGWGRHLFYVTNGINSLFNKTPYVKLKGSDREVQ